MTSGVLLLALMLTGAAAPHPDAPVKESAGRPVILIVHGLGRAAPICRLPGPGTAVAPSAADRATCPHGGEHM